jgi:hypothetical protein
MKMNLHRGSVNVKHRKKTKDGYGELGKRNRGLFDSTKSIDDDGVINKRHLIPRSIENTHPNHISEERNLITPMRSETTSDSKPTVREAESLSGCRNVQEANASNRKATGIHNRLDREIPNLKGC